MKTLFYILIFGLFVNNLAHAAQLCIAPIDAHYHQYGQYADYDVQVAKKIYSVSHEKPVKVTNIQVNKNMNITILKQGKAIESFSLKLDAKERMCLIKSSMYPTWLVLPMRKSCQC